MDLDVIIIGSGVIGAAMGFELSKAGFKTLNIDRNHDAGTGSTSASCAIIRVHYSTLDGSALAYEGYFDWKNWKDYLGVEDDHGIAKFVECGCLVMETEQNEFLKKHKSICSTLNIPFEEWDSHIIKKKLPLYSQESFAPAKRIGQDGFGFAYDETNSPIKIFHIGRVIIQNGVSIGANCTLDKGSFNDTIIGENTYIDNLVHIAHNVVIGNNCIIAGQCGFAGSSIVGNFVQIGGQTGIGGHIKISDNVKIAAKSGVIRDVSKGQTVMGYPAISMNKYLKNYKKIMM